MEKFSESSKLPKAVLVIFTLQFFFFILYYLENQEDKSLLYFAVGIEVIGVMLVSLKLRLNINRDEIRYGYLPMFPNRLSIDDIETMEFIKNDALGDFLGWGIRTSKKYGKGYITETDSALFIKKIDGTKVTISIANEQNLREYLFKIGRGHMLTN
ncbi:hypothetical protein ACL9RF_01250 [Sphingobacterium sp. Mn56C]|uniref:hypothetical protein n=1 Tax=Sphingobacterium sp. Mn56C TaxID=3395261 RepID=UPI003BC83DB4